MKYVTTKYEEYPAPLTGKVIKFNPSCKEFCITKTPTEQEFEQLINSYISKKIEITWNELLKPLNSKTKPPQLRIFYLNKCRKTMLSHYIRADYYLKALNESTIAHCERKISSLSLDEQEKLAQQIKPNSIEEANATFRSNSFTYNDPIGDKFINEAVRPCQNNFAKTINELASIIFQAIADGGTSGKYSNKTYANKTTRNTLEFLSYLHSKGYILFPYIKRRSNTEFETWMLHSTNIRHTEHQELVASSSHYFIQQIKSTSNTKRGTKEITSFASSLVRASNFTKLDHTSEEFLDRVFEVNAKGRKGINDANSKDRRFIATFNSFTNIVREMFNSTHDNLELKLNPKKFNRHTSKSVEDLINFSQYTNRFPELKIWSDLFAKFCTSVHDTQVSSRVSACRYFLDWLSGLEDIPTSPTSIIRKVHINLLDYLYCCFVSLIILVSMGVVMVFLIFRG